MKRYRKNVRSTQPTLTSIEEEPIMTELDFPTGTNSRTNLVTFKVIECETPTGCVATDQTGRFPVRSSEGNVYIMVAYVRDVNSILAEPMKNRAETTIVATYEKIYEALLQRGLKPVLQICDNECPSKFKKFLKKRDISLQLVPPYDHRTNPAEKAIDTFKSHFIAGLAGLPPQFPPPPLGSPHQPRHHHAQPTATIKIEPSHVCICPN